MSYKYKGAYKTKISPEELYTKFHEYMDHLKVEEEEDGKDRIPSFTGICDYCWISETTLLNYGRRDDFADVISHIRHLIVEKLQFIGINKSNSRFVEYVLNNRFPLEWSNKQIIETKEVKSLSTQAEQDEAIIEATKELERLTQAGKTPSSLSE